MKRKRQQIITYYIVCQTRSANILKRKLTRHFLYINKTEQNKAADIFSRLRFEKNVYTDFELVQRIKSLVLTEIWHKQLDATNPCQSWNMILNRYYWFVDFVVVNTKFHIHSSLGCWDPSGRWRFKAIARKLQIRFTVRTYFFVI